MQQLSTNLQGTFAQNLNSQQDNCKFSQITDGYLDPNVLKLLQDSYSLQNNPKLSAALLKMDMSTDSSRNSALDGVNHHSLAQNKKHYSVTSDEARHKFIELWNSGTNTIKQAAQECGINYSTAKSIVKLLKIEGRIEKKKKRASRKSKKQRDDLEQILKLSLKRQRLDVPKLSLSGDPNFLQQLGIADEPQASKEKLLVQKACDSKLAGITSDFFTFSGALKQEASDEKSLKSTMKQDKIVDFPKIPQLQNNFELIKRFQRPLMKSEGVIQQNEMSLQSCGSSDNTQSQTQNLVKRNLLFEVLVEKTLE